MRMELYLDGIDVGRLGTSRDKTLRRFLAKKKVTDSHRLMVSTAAAFNNEETVKTTYKKFQNALWYENISDERDREMQEYYEKYVKHLRPQLYVAENGETAVKGLDL